MGILLLLLLIALILLVLASIIGLCWYFANRLLCRTSSAPSFRILVTEIDTETITLQRTKNTRRPGVFGITGTDGQAIIGPVLSSDARTITRQLLQITGTITPPTKVAWNTTVYGGKLRNHLQLTIDEVSIPGSLGEMPAWFVPGTRDTWAILVHGSTGTREQGLRAFRTLTDLGLPILDITYRNDDSAPSSADGLSHLGDTEWEDLEASVKYALAQGAQRLLLYGWSMGGTIVEVFLSRSSYANHILAVVLDSPVLDWRATLDLLTRKNRLPSFIAKVTERLISMRTGIKFAALHQRKQTQSDLPILLFHGTSDTTAPISVSDTFASAYATVRYHRVPEAEHTQSWNADNQKYEAELRSFLRDVLGLEIIN